GQDRPTAENSLLSFRISGTYCPQTLPLSDLTLLCKNGSMKAMVIMKSLCPPNPCKLVPFEIANLKFFPMILPCHDSVQISPPAIILAGSSYPLGNRW